MNGRLLGTLILAAVAVMSDAAAVASSFEELPGLAEHFAERGLEPLPGQESMLVGGGVIGVLHGTQRGIETKPYVLITASPPAGMTAVRAMADIQAGRARELEGHPVEALLTSFERHLIVAFWEDRDAAGEDVIPLDDVAAYFDLSNETAAPGSAFRIEGAGSSPVWMRLIEQSNIPIGLSIEVDEAPNLGSARVTAYSAHEIPGLQLAVGTPVPESNSSFARTTLAALIASKVSRLEDPPVFQRSERPAEGGSARSQRPYTGTIPAYTAEVEGLLLEGVLPGGPAEEAGLVAGDIIIELAETVITDVYSYAAALDALEVDVPVSLVYLRNGERHETTLTPTARK